MKNQPTTWSLKYTKEELENLTTPLLTAISVENNELAKELINRGDSIEKCDHYGDTPIIATVQVGNVEMLKW